VLSPDITHLLIDPPSFCRVLYDAKYVAA